MLCFLVLLTKPDRRDTLWEIAVKIGEALKAAALCDLRDRKFGAAFQHFLGGEVAHLRNISDRRHTESAAKECADRASSHSRNSCEICKGDLFIEMFLNIKDHTVKRAFGFFLFHRNF